jgi:hypothetical protein
MLVLIAVPIAERSGLCVAPSALFNSNDLG